MIKDLFYGFLHELLRLSYRKEAKRYQNGLNHARKIQTEKLLAILSKNQNCAYGKRYRFAECHSVIDFRRFVPLTVYEDYLPYIDRIKRGEQKILTEEAVLLFEPTSGSSSAHKLIPYTKGLKAEFQKGIQPWLYDLYTHYPQIKYGKSYWSITPATQRGYTEGGISIGFEEDAAYFGKVQKYIMEHIFARPKGIAAETDMERFFFKTCLTLLKTKNLTLISVWNPSYLFILLDYIKMHREALLCHLSPSRKAEINSWLQAETYDRVWTKLAVISCWCDGHASQYHARLTAMFPRALIQPKGLLATEGFITFPLVGKNGAALSIYSHFFEFRSLRDGSYAEIDELKKNMQYEIIITTSGGLYRYCLKDMIEVTDYDADSGMPLVRFVGKVDKTSDLYGEKLNEVFVQKVIERFVDADCFYLVAPEKDRYVLYVDSEMPSATETAVDNALRENFHYDYCRKLGQLKCLKIFCLTGNARAAYLKECTIQGMRLGDIKSTALALNGGWDKIFEGKYVKFPDHP